MQNGEFAFVKDNLLLWKPYSVVHITGDIVKICKAIM